MTEKKPRPIKLHELEQQLNEERTARIRLSADYQNLEKRIIQEREELRTKANAAFLGQLFPIFDNFYRASAHTPKIDPEKLDQLTTDDLKKIVSYFQGLKMIEKQMEEVLSQAGLTRIRTKGEQFDPAVHEAISYEPSSEIPAENVIDEVEAGWQIGNQVIRPAKVRVSQG